MQLFFCGRVCVKGLWKNFFVHLVWANLLKPQYGHWNQPEIQHPYTTELCVRVCVRMRVFVAYFAAAVKTGAINK